MRSSRPPAEFCFCGKGTGLGFTEEDSDDRQDVSMIQLFPHRVDVFLSDLPWIRSCLSLQLCRELRKPIRQGTLVALALEFRAQRMRDRLGHIGLAQPGELARQFADLHDRGC